MTAPAYRGGLLGWRDKAARNVERSRCWETGGGGGGGGFAASSIVPRRGEEGENRQINVLADAEERNVLPKNTGSSWKKAKNLMD